MPDTGGFSGARRAVRVCNTTAKRRPQEWILLKKSVHCWLSSWTLTRQRSRWKADEVNENTDIVNDLGADSLDVVDLVMTLEDEFGIEVPDDAIESLRTVGDVVNFVDSHAQN